MTDERDKSLTKKPPHQQVSANNDVAAFLNKVQATPRQQPAGRQGRLIFAMDATASREPSWDRACQIQGSMFQATAAIGQLSIQLVFYRGFGECKSSKWHDQPAGLLRAMTAVRCLGGRTQIGRVLGHALKENTRSPVDALVFVGDAFEEDIDSVCHSAGELGLKGVPVFMFHEGGEPIAARAFSQIAKLSGGAYCAFDSQSAEQLRQLLAAVAVYASGGHHALLAHAEKTGGAALQLTHKLGR
jgi:hypothetical protein